MLEESNLHNVILGLDVGTTQTGYCFVDEDTFKPIQFGKIDNELIYSEIHRLAEIKCNRRIALEQFAFYGRANAMGATTIEAITWNGKFIRECEHLKLPWEFVLRKEETMLIVGNAKSGDKEVRHALISRFGKTKSGKGTKKNPDFFYGFAEDVWSAYSVALVAIMRDKGITNAKDWSQQER